MCPSAAPICASAERAEPAAAVRGQARQVSAHDLNEQHVCQARDHRLRSGTTRGCFAGDELERGLEPAHGFAHFALERDHRRQDRQERVVLAIFEAEAATDDGRRLSTPADAKHVAVTACTTDEQLFERLRAVRFGSSISEWAWP